MTGCELYLIKYFCQEVSCLKIFDEKQAWETGRVK